ncbi:carbohydrate kinase family protein [Aestuariimicrobium ganziense]|uniref:carbohydrate kinase family protein n=1 Tax=Aestuariimicrobium ganziense TaxID=2773677 RepID=UPI001941D1ED|nr:carbohydrate kinase [Aestuariimicrobium ganziense]
MTSVLCLGEALIDVVHRTGNAPSEHVGGSILNVASGLARLDHDTRLATWIGHDERGVRIAETATVAGVRLVEGSDGAAHTPVANAHIDAEGKATYDFDLEWRVPALDGVGEVGHLHTGSFAATLEPGGSDVLEAVRTMGRTASVSYDPNARPALMGTADLVRERIEQIVAASDLVKASDEDLAWLYPDRSAEAVLDGWIALGPKLVVVTRGADGASARMAGRPELVDLAPNVVDVGDTVGAGDSFMAGMVSSLLDQGLLGSREAVERLERARVDQVREALARAIKTSAITVSHVGAYSPTRDELG